jgi:K+-transporting ATPase ATPase C chain
MRRALIISLRMAVVTIVLTGLIYPFLVWGISAVVFPGQAAGSLVKGADGTVVGSSLIAQRFDRDEYFQPRPSAAGKDGYDAMSSGASNLGPTNQALVDDVKKRVGEVEYSDGVKPGLVPIDMVTTSASGLDPHISPDNAAAQVARVATARGMSADAVAQLVAQHTRGRDLGFLGEPRVNVLELNLALDGLSSK